MNQLPAIIIGGPPHAGKSVLFHALTKALRECGIAHHTVRANPDGEGNWSQEVDETTVKRLRVKAEWSDEFTLGSSRDIEHRLLPMLIDMGGKPKDAQNTIFQQCTHALLLLHQNDPQTATFWHALAEENHLQLFALLYSERQGDSVITQTSPVIQGTITHLERHQPVQGQLFDLLVERIVALFSSSLPGDPDKIYLDNAPTKPAIHVERTLPMLFPNTKEWEPAMLPTLLVQLSSDDMLSVYGKGPHWLYSALAAWTTPQPFYQFDPRFDMLNGWLQPPSLHFGTSASPDIQFKAQEYADAIILTVDIRTKHLDYFQADSFACPPLSTTRGLIIDGQIPSWLSTALVRLYMQQELPWIACHYPPLHGAVIVQSRIDSRSIGDLFPMPLHEY